MRDRHAVYERLRREAPVHFSERLKAWIVTRYDDVVAVLLDNERFSAGNSIGIEPFEAFPPEVRAVLDTGLPRFPGIIEMDPPEHTRYRSLVNLAFTPRRTATLEPRVRQIAHELIDGVAEHGRMDFVERFGDPMPIRVIGEILGVPPDDMPEVQQLSDAFRTLEAGTVRGLPLDEQIETARQFVSFQHYVAAMIEARRGDPGDDLVSSIVDAKLGGERPLTIDELVSTVIHVLFAGQETATRLLASMTYMLLADRWLWEELLVDRTLVPNTVEEALRMDPPVTYHLRLVTRPVRVGNVELAPGDTVHLVFSAANRDDKMFPSPDTFDPRRGNANRHLGFGRGIHFCVGAPIGRLEGRVGLEVLLERLPSLRLAPDYTLELEDHVMLSGLARLPVEWDPPKATRA
jgi:cytochrome P450